MSASGYNFLWTISFIAFMGMLAVIPEAIGDTFWRWFVILLATAIFWWFTGFVKRLRKEAEDADAEWRSRDDYI